MRKKLKYILGLSALLFIAAVQPAWAAGPPAPSIFSNPLAVILIVLMILLLIIIAVLANILVGAADVKLKKRKALEKNSPANAVMFILLMLAAPSLLAQDAPTTETATKAASTIGGMTSSAFYVMATILFLELVVILVLLFNIKSLLKQEKEKLVTESQKAQAAAEKANKLSWWDRFNKLRPVSQEAELDLGHEYDGIRELNNRLPPWWLYGFYATILFAVIYLWRFHVSHSGPSSKQEYERSVARAEIKIKNYLKAKGEAVDENTVTILTAKEDMEAGKAIFLDPSKCPACHNADGGGNTVGPNLTDDYWLYGGSIKDIFKTIKYGTNKGMRSWKDDLSAKQMAQVASYIKSLKGTKPANPKEPQGELYVEEAAPVKPAADTSKNTVSKPG